MEMDVNEMGDDDARNGKNEREDTNSIIELLQDNNPEGGTEEFMYIILECDAEAPTSQRRTRRSHVNPSIHPNKRIMRMLSFPRLAPESPSSKRGKIMTSTSQM